MPIARVRRQRRLAVLALGAAALLAAIAFPFRSTWWGGWVLAIAEAGVVGGLADWFAVTAIFRRPLGLPIPHTALIPANWELMAVRVGTMVGDRVLTKTYVTDEIGRLDLADLLARASARVTRDDLETVTRLIARWAAEQLPPQAAGDLIARLRHLAVEWPLAPPLATLLEAARQHGWDQRAIAGLGRALADALDRPAFAAAVGELVEDLLARYREQAGAYPRFWIGLATLFGLIDRERIVAALRAGLREVADDPEHPLRRRLAQTLGGLPARLRSEAELAARVEALKHELLASGAARRLIDDVAAELRRALVEDLKSERSELVGWVADRLERARLTIITDVALRRDLDRWIKRRAVELVERYHGRVAAFIENGVRALGPEGAVRLIEEHAGDDLQYIRVNGTVVGGLAGGAIYAIHLLLRLL
jgi:uncharacterized membrane-anchored protein YjiN (DUF445 family)